MKQKWTLKAVTNFLFRSIPIYYIGFICNILPNHLYTNKIRGALVSPFLGKCGRNFQLAQGVIINHPERIFVGNNCYFAHRMYINAEANLYIEDNVTCGPMCVLATTNHSVRDGVVLDEGSSGAIHIGKGTWCGANVTITSGVTIGRSVIVGAGSVVTKNIPDNTLSGGIPAKVIKEIHK